MDLQDFIRIFRKWRLIIIILPILTTIATAFYYFQIALPTYSSSTKVLVIHQQNEQAITGVDLTTSTNLINDYCALVAAAPFKQETAERLGMEMSQMSGCSISVSKISDTRMVTISVTSHDPALSQRVVQELTLVSIERAKDFLQTDNIRRVETASKARQTGPASMRNTMIGFAVGLGIAVGFALLVEMLNTTVRTAEDVEKHMGVPILAQIPRFE